MRFWPLYGITRLLSERRIAPRGAAVSSLPRAFRRSLHIYPIDVGNSNALNLEMAAMKTAQYNIHRYGIFFADTPRHADLLIILGIPLASLQEHLRETLTQFPRPFGILWLRETARAIDTGGEVSARRIVEESGGTLVAELDNPSGPAEIISVLRRAMRGGGE